MNIIKFKALRSIVKINSVDHYLYTGYLSAEDIMKIAVVPSFLVNKKHHKIANDVYQPPVDQWQRPTIKEKVQHIKKIYSSTSKNNLMPNPVLLGTSYDNYEGNDSRVQVEEFKVPVGGGSSREVVVPELYNIIVHSKDNKKPIWIIDGQHRIKGLKASSQKNNEVPIVLLHEDRSTPNIYRPAFLAEIFTHVTTGADPMKEEHGEWMKYAFRLNEYSNSTDQKAMETVIHLCTQQTSVFFDKITFNPENPSAGHHAFKFNCIELKQIFKDSYWAKNPTFTISPSDLADYISNSIKSFESLDRKAGLTSKIFNGVGNVAHKNLATAFLQGLLSYLSNITSSPPFSQTDWDTFFTDKLRNTPTCDFELPWIISSGSLSSGGGVRSKDIARECFEDFFENPAKLNSQLFTNFLHNHGGQIEIYMFNKKSNGRVAEHKSIIADVNPPGTPSTKNVQFWDANGVKLQYIKFKPLTSNVRITRIWEHTIPSHQEVNIAKSVKKGKYSKPFDVHSLLTYNTGTTFQIIIDHEAYTSDSQNQMRITLYK